MPTETMDHEDDLQEASTSRQTRRPLSKLSAQVNWRAVIAESVFIGASILLAFALQDWDEATDIEDRTLIALCNVKFELEFNRVLIDRDFMPRQQGMLALSSASIAALQIDPEAETDKTDLYRLMVNDSLRRSAWTLTSESGYLLHADFEMATEIGALIDYQEGQYQVMIGLVRDAVFEHNGPIGDVPIDYYLRITDLVTEWVGQTSFLDRKYEDLFANETFANLACDA